MEVETGKKLERAPKSTIGLWLESKSEPAPKRGLFFGYENSKISTKFFC
jgi:hypothetical protein